ncbi:hypothetical protein H5410_050204 [Solanum commersonii]|uniref:Uncharacterized protein n=1 Tax=Solanum commersonii TaxID=4109 RepID=A0A9J5WUT5_SOLCO|nr:hypothetical protein H5410_050204 [Solanum commersonii]
MKGTCGVFRVEEGSSSVYSRPRENLLGWNSKRYEEGFHPRYLQRGGNQGWNYHNEEEQKRYYQYWAEQRADKKERRSRIVHHPLHHWHAPIF